MTPKKPPATKVTTVPSTPPVAKPESLAVPPDIPPDQLASDGEEVVAGLEEDKPDAS